MLVFVGGWTAGGVGVVSYRYSVSGGVAHVILLGASDVLGEAGDGDLFDEEGGRGVVAAAIAGGCLTDELGAAGVASIAGSGSAGDEECEGNELLRKNCKENQVNIFFVSGYPKMLYFL